MAEDRVKAELIADLAAARARLSDNALALRHDLDFSSRAKKAFKSSPLPWLGGAALAGLILARLGPGRTKKSIRPAAARQPAEPMLEKAGKAGMLLGILKMVLDFARPAVTAWARKRVTDYIATRQAQGDLRH
jgi:hypothetical protein